MVTLLDSTPQQSGGAPSRRDRAVRAFVRRELYPHTEAGRARIDASPIDRGRIRSVDDLRAVEPVTLADVGDGSGYLVRPTRSHLIRSGSPSMRARTLWASTWGRWNAFLATIEPHYRPVHFFSADRLPVGAAAADLIRLAGLGVEWLRASGIGRDDAVALVGGAGSGIEAWQLSGGTRRSGVPLVVLDDPTVAERHQVTVVAGTEAAVLDAVAGGAWPELRLVLVWGPSAVDATSRVAALGGGVAVRRAWAVPGARSVWFECRGGAEHGWHTTFAAELIEVDDEGEVLWTGLRWAGTVFLRLRTDVRASRVDDGPCPACGHAGPRIVPAAGSPALARFLSADSRVADVRLTAAGADVLPRRAGANARLVADARKAFPDQAVSVLTKRAWADAS